MRLLKAVIFSGNWVATILLLCCWFRMFRCCIWCFDMYLPISFHLPWNQGLVSDANTTRDILCVWGPLKPHLANFLHPSYQLLIQCLVPSHHPIHVWCTSVCNMDEELWVKHQVTITDKRQGCTKCKNKWWLLIKAWVVLVELCKAIVDCGVIFDKSMVVAFFLPCCLKLFECRKSLPESGSLLHREVLLNLVRIL